MTTLVSLMPQQNMATNTVSQQGSQRQEQTERLYLSQSDLAQLAAVKLFDALHRINTKHYDFSEFIEW